VHDAQVEMAQLGVMDMEGMPEPRVVRSGPDRGNDPGPPARRFTVSIVITVTEHLEKPFFASTGRSGPVGSVTRRQFGWSASWDGHWSYRLGLRPLVPSGGGPPSR
jgi:hypothetical protein